MNTYIYTFIIIVNYTCVIIKVFFFSIFFLIYNTTNLNIITIKIVIL